MAKSKRKGSYDKEREKAKREAGIKQLVITVPDLSLAVPGGIGEGVYLKIDIVLPRWGNRAVYSQFYVANRRRKRIELVEDFSLMKDDIERLHGLPMLAISDEKFLAKVVALPAEYRSRAKVERDIEKVAGLLTAQPDQEGKIERVLTLQEQAERAAAEERRQEEEAVAQTAVIQPAQEAAPQPAQPAVTQPAQEAAPQPAQTAAPQPAQEASSQDS